jgi:hypothetical protein
MSDDAVAPDDKGKRSRRSHLFRLESPEEKAALSELCSGVSNMRVFARQVLAGLQLIESIVLIGDRKESHHRKANIVRDLKRRAREVRKFGSKMEQSLWQQDVSDNILYPIEPALPLQELYKYADQLEKLADRQTRPLKRKPPRHQPRPGTLEIVRLAKFVRQHAGSPRWDALAILLRRPTKIMFNEASLRQLVKFHTDNSRRRLPFQAASYLSR